MFALRWKWLSYSPQAKINVFPSWASHSVCRTVKAVYHSSIHFHKLGDVNELYDMMKRGEAHTELQPPPCAPPWMEKELARISKNFSFSITKADNWLREGLWFEWERGREKKNFIGPNGCWQTDHILQKTWQKGKNVLKGSLKERFRASSHLRWNVGCTFIL